MGKGLGFSAKQRKEERREMSSPGRVQAQGKSPEAGDEGEAGLRQRHNEDWAVPAQVLRKACPSLTVCGEGEPRLASGIDLPGALVGVCAGGTQIHAYLGSLRRVQDCPWVHGGHLLRACAVDRAGSRAPDRL